MTTKYLIQILQGIAVVTYNNCPEVSVICNELQSKADYDGTPVACVYEGIPLLALPNGSADRLVQGYYKAKEQGSVDQTIDVWGAQYSFSTPPLTKLPKFIDWVRSLELPGEING